MNFIDIHIHGGFGINFDTASSEEINYFAKCAFQKNIKAFCPTLTGGTVEGLNERIKNIHLAKNNQKKDEAIIIGANLEGTFLSKEKPGVQNPDNFLEPTIENFKKIAGKFENDIKIVVIAPENRNCSEFINYLKSKNIKVHFGHTTTNSLIGADAINHLFNAMEPMTHKKETLAIKALLDKEIYTELIADTKHICTDVLKLTFKIRPKDKILLISDALPIAASNLEKIEFCNKTVLNTGYDENGILGGSVMLLPDIVENLIRKRIITEDEANLMAYENQKNYLKLML